MCQEEAGKEKKAEVKQDPHMRCNFCGKDVSEVFTLITGPSVNICDQCIMQGVSIITKEINRREAKLEKLVPFNQNGEE